MSGQSTEKVRVLLIGYRKFSEMVNAIMVEFEAEANVTIVESVANHDTQYHSLIAQHNPDVVASAGSNAAFLANTLTVPVICQPVTDIDVIEALAKAQRISPKVHLFTYQPENSPPSRLFESLPKLIGIELIHHTYSTASEANEALQLALVEDAPQVVVGPSFTCHMAEQQGVPTILVYSKESTRQMLRAAIEAGRRQPELAPPENTSAIAEQFVIHSAQMQQVVAAAKTYAQSSGAVLIEGESGTGKEQITKEIYRHCYYRDGPLVAVNCGTVPADLFESEFFGYADGAFTGSRRGGRKGLLEQANGGVLYLDEVGELPPAQQVKLLRVLQEMRVRPLGSHREIPVAFKLIAATNSELRAAVNSGKFRADLYYRLNVLSLKVPPLRERREDIEAIARHYMNRFATQYRINTDVNELFGAVAEQFERYSWPGNVRELRNFVERIVVSCLSLPAGGLSAANVQRVLPELEQTMPPQPNNSGSLRLQEQLAIKRAMHQFSGDKAQVADYLGMSPTTLWRRLRTMNEIGYDPDRNISGNN